MPLRNASAADIPEILKLIEANSATILKRSVEELTALLPTTWVVEEDGNILGCCTLEIYGPKIAEVRTVAVNAAYQGKGFGKALVQRAVDEALARGIPQILTVTSRLDFFEKLNFGPCLNEKYALFYSGKGAVPLQNDK